MPRYDYICHACGIFEHSCALQAATDPVACPTCATEAKRVYSPPNLVKTPAVQTKRLDRAHKSAYEQIRSFMGLDAPGKLGIS